MKVKQSKWLKFPSQPCIYALCWLLVGQKFLSAVIKRTSRILKSNKRYLKKLKN